MALGPENSPRPFPLQAGFSSHPWALQASFAGTAARAVEGAGQVWFTLLLSDACFPLFLALEPGLCGVLLGLDLAEDRDGGDGLWAS